VTFNRIVSGFFLHGTVPGDNALPGELAGLEDQGKGSLQLLAGLLHHLSEGQALDRSPHVVLFCIVVNTEKFLIYSTVNASYLEYYCIQTVHVQVQVQ